MAILANPYGAFKAITPYPEDKWTQNFMALRGTLDATPAIICNVYAPHTYDHRKTFYKTLQNIEFPAGVLLFVGGDFNCTLDERAGRSFTSASGGHGSPALRALLNIWGLLDPIAVARPSKWKHEGLLRHHFETHTYHYTLAGGTETSSRLDRWYMSRCTLSWVADWHTAQLGAKLDHLGTKLHARSPEDPIRIRRPPRIYPVPQF